jgi:hypothetical protein
LRKTEEYFFKNKDGLDLCRKSIDPKALQQLFHFLWPKHIHLEYDISEDVDLQRILDVFHGTVKEGNVLDRVILDFGWDRLRGKFCKFEENCKLTREIRAWEHESVERR